MNEHTHYTYVHSPTHTQIHIQIHTHTHTHTLTRTHTHTHTHSHTPGAGEDYVTVSMDLTFGPNTTEQCHLLLLVQDLRCEESMSESFGVRLSSTENGITAVQDSASVVIYDAPDCSEQPCIYHTS